MLAGARVRVAKVLAWASLRLLGVSAVDVSRELGKWEADDEEDEAPRVGGLVVTVSERGRAMLHKPVIAREEPVRPEPLPGSAEARANEVLQRDQNRW